MSDHVVARSRRVVHIDVGDIPPEELSAFIKGAASVYQQRGHLAPDPLLIDPNARLKRAREDARRRKRVICTLAGASGVLALLSMVLQAIDNGWL